MRRSRPQNAYRVSLSAMLISLMLVLGYIESLIPTGVPGIRIGLSNGVLIFSVYMLGIPSAYILIALKVFLSGLLFSGVTGMMYAFMGGLVSLTVMSLLSRFKRLSPVLVSMAGGVTHNMGQIAVALLILSRVKQMFLYLLLLTVTGLICGLVTGTAAVSVMKHVKIARPKISRDPKEKKKALVLTVFAMITVTIVFYFAFHAVRSASPVGIITEENDSPLLKPEDLPFSLE